MCPLIPWPDTRMVPAMFVKFLAALVMIALISASAPDPAPAVETPFEVSGGARTPTTDETMSWFADLAAGSPVLEFRTFGSSGRGRDLPVVVADAQGRFDPADHRNRKDHTVLLVQACIHAGESCGKDAGMQLLRDIVEDRNGASALLERVTLVFVPIFNVDGHDRFGPYNRINQNGPEEMGWRVTSRNQNLNRDFFKADTPEMRAWLRLFQAWLPDFFIDIHSTDGADYQYPITYSLETRGNMDAGLTDWTKKYEAAMIDRMGGDGHLLGPYVSFRDWHDPRSGIKSGTADPRFSTGYTALQNRPGLLVETHMLKEYPVRVETARLLWVHTMEWLNEHGPELRSVVLEADRQVAAPAFREGPFALEFEFTEESRPFEFAGISYEEVTSEVTGGPWFRYGGEPETMQLELFDQLEPSVTVSLPAAYLVPPEWYEAVERLEAHGIPFRRLSEPVELDIRTWRFSDAKWREKPYEGHHTVSFTAIEHTEMKIFPAGTVVVDMNQRAARVVAHLLEPQGPDSLVKWGYFDAVFERVEYVESYVIEQMIPQMLAENPKLAEELEAAKAASEEFANDPWAIRYWFYAKTPYFDKRVGVYPVGMLDDPTTLAGLPLE